MYSDVGLRLLYYKILKREMNVLPAQQCDVIRTDQAGEHCSFCLLVISRITADALYKDGVEKQINVCTERPSACHWYNAVILSQGMLGTERWKIGPSAGT